MSRRRTLPPNAQCPQVSGHEETKSALTSPQRAIGAPKQRSRQVLMQALLTLGILFLITLWCKSRYRPRKLFSNRKAPSFNLQADGLEQTQLSKERSQTVLDSFKWAYDQYVQHAWGRDQIMPASLGGKDTRNGWGATIVDALSTLYIMDLKNEFEAGVQFACNIDFSDSRIPEKVSLFETTIRYLGGMLSAYELSEPRHPCLLKKAKQLGDKLAFAWPEGSVIPFPHLNFTTNERLPDEKTCTAEVGTLIIEFDRLSYLTNNDTYRQLAYKSLAGLMSRHHEFPGLHTEYLSLHGKPMAIKVGWGSGIDSFLEYGPKYWQLVGEKGSDFFRYWIQSVSSSVKHLLHESRDGHLYLYEHSGLKGRKIHYMSHLSCFAPGNWMLGAKLIGDNNTFHLGLRLAETCAYSYEAMPSGIGPEAFFDLDGELVALDRHFYLRPEVVESIWYAWRMTGDPIWQERGWAIFEAFEKQCRHRYGYTELENVDSDRPEIVNNTESFLFAELFKYFYLLFTPPEILSLNDFVLNTEAHPFKIRPRD